MRIPNRAFARLARGAAPYALALALVSAGIGASMLLRQYGSNRPFLIFIFAAVLASSWIGGIGPGWLAVGFATLLVDYYYIPPRFHFAGDLRDVPWLVAFVVCATVGNILAARQRKSKTLLQKAHDTLEARVAERTAALEYANQSLKSEMNERARAEAALRESQIELERMARLTAMGELTASIAHEINQPLASIGVNAAGGLRWLEGQPANLNEARAAIERIERDSKRAGAIIARIRSLARRAAPEETPLNLNDIVREVLNLTGSSLAANGVRVQLRLGEALPKVMGDRIELQQVVLNLIMNAKDAMAGNGARPRTLTLRSATDDTGSVVVRVEDSGGGIAADLRDQIFTPFFTTKRDGMGMGLAICKSIVQHHGGRIWVQNDAGGAVFAFAVPARAEVVRLEVRESAE